MYFEPHMALSSSHSEQESFHEFFQCWIAEQDQHLHELLSVSKAQLSSEEDKETAMVVLIDRVVKHYEEYYRVKSKCSDENILGMFSPSWTSSLEDAFLWIGGWRPSMAFHLVYSKSGLQLEAKMDRIIQGALGGVSDLGELTQLQLSALDAMQRETIKEERKITEKMAKHQETIADMSMVELAHIVTGLQLNGEVEDARVDSSLAPKEEGLYKVLERADDLRLKTLKGVISILDPIQTVHFLIAAAELHLRIHEWGHKRDAAAATNANISKTSAR